jgi:uncharacterized integral membrane protein
VNAGRWLPAAGVALLAAGFALLNRGERVAVDLGLVHFYRASLTLVVLGAFLAGMLAMLLLGLRHDRRVRDELRARGLLEPAPSPLPARAPAASAWGITRESAPTYASAASDGDGTRVFPDRRVEGPHAVSVDDDRTAAFGIRANPHGRAADGALASVDADRTSALADDGHRADVDHTAGFGDDADSHPDPDRTIIHPPHEDGSRA